MPPPSPLSFSENAFEAKRRLKREVIHRLASGNKTHSEMTEVSSVLSQRENAVLCKTFVNPEDASGAALEDALSEVAVRKQRSGEPDEWELLNDAWKEYDPAFHHISTRAHQSATENRPKPSPASPYAPRPAPAHSSFKRIRRDLTSDSCVLAMVYRILHVHCCETHDDSPLSNSTEVRGDLMYKEQAKSEAVLARAVHLLTLGAYAWEDACSSDMLISDDWSDLGGGDVGSIFYNRENAPIARDWVAMALLRDPSEVMSCKWYIGKENALTLLKRIGFEAGDCSGFLGGVDPALRSGAAFLCEFAAKFNPDAVSSGEGGTCESMSPMKVGEQERKKNAAKERAMAMMRAQMDKFAANIGHSPGYNDNDGMSEGIDECMSPSRGSSVASSFSTPVRNRSDSEVGVMSPTREFNFSSPITSPNSPYTPHTPQITPRTTSRNTGMRLMHERPQCIVCGGDSHDPMQVELSLSRDSDVNNHENSREGVTRNDKALAFCGYSQASTVITGGDRVPARGRVTSAHFQSHVGVHITLCGHAIHKDCCDAYLKTVASQRFDRLEGGKKREFRCPLCQRLSNCLVPFVDVAADWTDRILHKEYHTSKSSTSFSSDEGMQIDCSGDTEKAQLGKADGHDALHFFLSTSKWWASRNDRSVSWDRQCTFSVEKDDAKTSGLPYVSSPRQSLIKLQSKFGKKELISAWNSVLKTPRSVTRRVRSSSPDRSTTFTYNPNVVSREKESNSDVIRRFIDQVSDVAYRADMRRIGEENLFSNFGEFRHYLSEKAAYNVRNRAAGREMVDVSTRGSLSSVNDLCVC